MALSTYLRNKLYDHTYRATGYTAPAAVYLALFTTDPTVAGSGTEVSGGSYARQAITAGAPTNGAGENSALITFPTASGSWGTVAYFGIYDASTAGNLLSFGPLAANRTVASGEIFTVPIGDLDLTYA